MRQPSPNIAPRLLLLTGLLAVAPCVGCVGRPAPRADWALPSELPVRTAGPISPESKIEPEFQDR